MWPARPCRTSCTASGASCPTASRGLSLAVTPSSPPSHTRRPVSPPALPHTPTTRSLWCGKPPATCRPCKHLQVSPQASPPSAATWERFLHSPARPVLSVPRACPLDDQDDCGLVMACLAVSSVSKGPLQGIAQLHAQHGHVQRRCPVDI